MRQFCYWLTNDRIIFSLHQILTGILVAFKVVNLLKYFIFCFYFDPSKVSLRLLLALSQISFFVCLFNICRCVSLFVCMFHDGQPMAISVGKDVARYACSNRREAIKDKEDSVAQRSMMYFRRASSCTRMLLAAIYRYCYAIISCLILISTVFYLCTVFH